MFFNTCALDDTSSSFWDLVGVRLGYADAVLCIKRPAFCASEAQSRPTGRHRFIFSVSGHPRRSENEAFLNSFLMFSWRGELSKMAFWKNWWERWWEHRFCYRRRHWITLVFFPCPFLSLDFVSDILIPKSRTGVSGHAGPLERFSNQDQRQTDTQKKQHLGPDLEPNTIKPTICTKTTYKEIARGERERQTERARER